MENISRELIKIAKLLTGFQFDTKEEMEKYLKEHPEADRHLHTYKKDTTKKNVKQNLHEKSKVNKQSISKVTNILKSNGIGEDDDSIKELSGFKKTLGQRIPQKDIGKWYVRNENKLKSDFVKNMNPENYGSSEAFQNAKKRIMDMPVADFGKILAAIESEEEKI